MKDFKKEWHHRQRAMMEDWQQQVDEEWIRWQQKEAVVRAKCAQKRREAKVLLKIQAIDAANKHLKNLVPNTLNDLQEVAFPDDKGMAINRIFLPQLLGQVQEQVRARAEANAHAAEVAALALREHVTAKAAAAHVHAELRRVEAMRRYEELQIKRGRIKILVDDGAGGKVVVGPIQISSEDNVETIQGRVFDWMQINEAELAAMMPNGVLLQVAGVQLVTVGALFQAKVGHISMVAKPAPTSPELPQAGEDSELEDEADDETGI